MVCLGFEPEADGQGGWRHPNQLYYDYLIRYNLIKCLHDLYSICRFIHFYPSSFFLLNL